MTLVEFLTRVLPPGLLVAGKLVHRVNAEGKPFAAFAHTLTKSHASLASILTEIDAGKSNAYFALAVYKKGFHPNPKKPGAKQLRVRDNVDSLKALWIDIDFKDGYGDVNTAATALTVFCKSASMPAPSIIVHSGNGLHVYWTFDKPVPEDKWQRLADALKTSAQEYQFKIDPTCTADACRVLRPIDTHNWKDPANPKPVRVLFASARDYTYEEMEAVLMPWVGAVRPQMAAAFKQMGSVYDELTGGLTRPAEATSIFDRIRQHCGVAKMLVDTHGATAMEPLWMASLQLLRHCADGEIWVHPISDGHPGYSAGNTDAKWLQRSTSHGPTLCSNFEQFESKICAACPHRGFIKSPIQLGDQEAAPLEGLPPGWRIAAERRGIERLMIDPTNNQKEWVKVLRHVVANLRVTRSIVTERYDYAFDVEYGNSKPWSLTLPGGSLGNPRKLAETLAEYGILFKEKEGRAFLDLMTSWLGQLQAARRVADVTEQLGWLVEKTDLGEKINGFSYGPTTFYADGRQRNDVKAAREFANIARFYEPKGGLDAWKKVARFLSDQNIPAFTAALAASFGTPLLRFTGLSGGILSIVSTASGVGKSSALKCSQAVWGSPTHGINAVDDTPKSVARKLGFLNNLPAYWDELRGRKTVDEFLTLAFQITQGKEKTRLDSSAQLREVATWETMLIVASNESIFEAMGRFGHGSDAGVVRTFEITVEKFETDRNKAEIQLMFEALNSNYGHAGKVYSQYLATHSKEVEERVQEVFKRLALAAKMDSQERFWFAIASILIVGAELAATLDLAYIDTRTLTSFLLGNINRLRGRSNDAVSSAGPSEVLAAFMAAHQDRMLIVDKFPASKSKLPPDITGGIPRADKVMFQIARDSNIMRVPKQELERWMQFREMPIYTVLKQLRENFGMRQLSAVIGLGTRWALPKQVIYEFDLSRFGLSHERIELAPGLAEAAQKETAQDQAP